MKKVPLTGILKLAAVLVILIGSMLYAFSGFQATIRFDEGVRRCIDYVLSHPECQQEDPEFDQWCDHLIEVLEAAKKQF